MIYYVDETLALYELKTEQQKKDLERNIGVKLTEVDYEFWKNRLITYGGI